LRNIYNRGNNGEILFREERNYPYFLKLYAKYIEPVAATYAYCLMSNHFHLLVRIKDFAECEQVCQSLKDWQTYEDVYPSRAFSNLFSTYTKAFNKAYQRTGSLFEKPFRRKLVNNDRYFTALVVYIHRNPQKHGFVTDYRDWLYSSYSAIVSGKATRVQRDTVLDWFDGWHGFEELHLSDTDEMFIKPLIADDFM
jgi:putative transposase